LQFCENYRQFARLLKGSMRQIHRAGEKLFIDYASPTVALGNSQYSQQAHIFVAAMSASGYCFALSTPGQTARDWLHTTARALSFLGGVPQPIVPTPPRFPEAAWLPHQRVCRD
jgi:transposase